MPYAIDGTIERATTEYHATYSQMLAALTRLELANAHYGVTMARDDLRAEAAWLLLRAATQILGNRCGELLSSNGTFSGERVSIGAAVDCLDAYTPGAPHQPATGRPANWLAA